MQLSDSLKSVFNGIGRAVWGNDFYKQAKPAATSVIPDAEAVNPLKVMQKIADDVALAKKLDGENLRVLTNPETRVVLRPDFPATLNASSMSELLQVLDAELKKFGSDLDTVSHINVAYPHKNPELYPGHYDNAFKTVESLLIHAKNAQAKVDFIPADAICENVRLGRSEDQSSAHALASHQIYDIHLPSQRRDMPFLKKDSTEKEFFVVADWCVEQGTTVANLISYIEHNGGIVLAVVTDWGKNELAQKSESSMWKPGALSREFANADVNSARLPQMAYTFSACAKSEGLNWSPQECMEKFEAALNKCGNTVFALTDGECKRVIETVNNSNYRGESFTKLLANLEKRAALQPEKPAPKVQAQIGATV